MLANRTSHAIARRWENWIDDRRDENNIIDDRRDEKNQKHGI